MTPSTAYCDKCRRLLLTFTSGELDDPTPRDTAIDCPCGGETVFCFENPADPGDAAPKIHHTLGGDVARLSEPPRAQPSRRLLDRVRDFFMAW